VVNRAAPPDAPANAPLSRNLALATVVGLILGVGAALLRENLDRALKGPDDVQRLVGLPVLSAVPRIDGRKDQLEPALATIENPESALADAYHKVRTAVQFASVNRPIRSVLVTSANQGEGKTVSSANLAWAMASVVDRVTLVDGDFRRPRLHEVFAAKNDIGMSDHVLGGADLDDLAIRVESPEGLLRVIRTGSLPPNPSDFVASRAFNATLAELAEKEGDLLIIDGPPVLPVSDALSLARQVDVVVLVAFAQRTTSEQLLQARQALEQVGAELLGVILVAVRQGAGYYRYGYYSPDADANRFRSEPPVISLPEPRRSRGERPLRRSNGSTSEVPESAEQRTLRRLRQQTGT
jgi:receptor protein-tyrosine kinase